MIKAYKNCVNFDGIRILRNERDSIRNRIGSVAEYKMYGGWNLLLPSNPTMMWLFHDEDVESRTKNSRDLVAA